MEICTFATLIHFTLFSYPKSEEQAEMFVQKGLVFLVASTEFLQELVGQFQNLQHLGVTLYR